MKENLYHYRGRVDRVIDQDTLVADLDLGFRTYRRVHVQLSAGLEMSEELQAALPGHDVIIRSVHTDGFGRVVTDKIEYL